MPGSCLFTPKPCSTVFSLLAWLPSGTQCFLNYKGWSLCQENYCICFLVGIFFLKTFRKKAGLNNSLRRLPLSVLLEPDAQKGGHSLTVAVCSWQGRLLKQSVPGGGDTVCAELLLMFSETSVVNWLLPLAVRDIRLCQDAVDPEGQTHTPGRQQETQGEGREGERLKHSWVWTCYFSGM